MSLHYFTRDGSYGDGEDLVVVDTNTWTDEMWELIENASDSMRIVIAHRLKHGYSVEEAGK